MHPHYQCFLVIRAVEDADLAAAGQAGCRAPKVVVIEFLLRWRLEGVHLYSLRIDAGHHVLDGAVLSGGVHRLENKQERPPVLGVEYVLELGQSLDAALKEFLRLWL